MKPKFDAKALLGAKKKSVGDIASWARGGMGKQMRNKYMKDAAAEGEDVEHEMSEGKEEAPGSPEECTCKGEGTCGHCAEMKLLASVSPDAIRKLLFNK